MILPMIGYLLGHFCLYAIILRKWDVLQKERGIFLYHVVPAIVVTLTVLANTRNENFSGAALILAAQGIYSLSFLEIWSLTQGGYSIRILAAIDEGNNTGNKLKLSDLEAFGANKTEMRLTGLKSLGLVNNQGKSWELTKKGKVAAACLGLVVRLVNHRTIG